MLIMKFGGSSLANAKRFAHVAGLVRDRIGERPVLVLSAMGKTTDLLIQAGKEALEGKVDIQAIRELHEETALVLGLCETGISPLFEELSRLLQGISLIKDLSLRSLDALVSFGERLSCRLFSAYLNQQGMEAQAFDGWEIGIVTTSEFTKAEILPQTYEQVAEVFQKLPPSLIPVVTGFIAKDLAGAITTLGRGGSDLTASIIGASIQAKEIQVWKDVDGILTTDPKCVSSARPIPFISFEEAAELAYFGAKVLHPSSLLPAMKKQIPVRVKNSYDPGHPGTLILSQLENKSDQLKAITRKSNQALVHICSTRMLGQFGFLAKVFEIFAELRISVDVIATSEVSLSLTVDNKECLKELERRLEQIATVHIQEGNTIISLVGSLTSSLSILERALQTLNQENIQVKMISHGASKVNISLVIDDQDALRCILALHTKFFN